MFRLCLEFALLWGRLRRLTGPVSSDLPFAKDRNAEISECSGNPAQHAAVLCGNCCPSQVHRGVHLVRPGVLPLAGLTG